MSNLKPSFNSSTNTISIPDVEGVEFLIGGKPVEGDVVIRRDTRVRVRAERGYVLAKGSELEYRFEASKLDAPKEVETVPDEQPKPADPTPADTAAGRNQQRVSKFGQTHQS